VLVIGIRRALPAVSTLGQDSPGAASGLIGCGQFPFGALAPPISGLFGTTSALPITLVVFVSFAPAAITVVGMVRPWHRPVAATPADAFRSPS
jgi:hypothetical protein